MTRNGAAAPLPSAFRTSPDWRTYTERGSPGLNPRRYEATNATTVSYVTTVALRCQPMASPGEWVLLAYRLPREPSTPRIALWRRLKRLGAVQLLDGLVALPADAKTREQLEWAADEVVEAGGDASIWTARPGTGAEERALAARMAHAVAADYRAVVDAAEAAEARSDPAARRRTLRRL